MSEHPQHSPHPAKRGLHKDWRLWVGVILMLLAMVVYVITLDESEVPTVGAGPQNPPAAQP